MPAIAKTITVDAHQHFLDLGKFQYPWMTEEMVSLQRNYLPADLRPVLDRVGIDRTVFVQAQHSLEETQWALELAEANPWIAGVVGWLDLRSPRLEEQIERYSDNSKFVGARHIVHDEPDERWLLRDDVVRGLQTLAKHDLTYDLLLRPPHLRHIPELARRVPGLKMIVDHLAKPLIRAGELEPWRTDLAAVARIPGMHCKISGMVNEADMAGWRAADFVPYVDTALDLFGPSRLMFGSDWPVCRLAGEYSEVLAAAQATLAGLSADERAAVFGGNAIRFYQLPA
jgi:L-fuconolactonase